MTRQKRSSVNCGISKGGLSDRHPSLERGLILITIPTGPFIIDILLQCHLPTRCLGTKCLVRQSCSSVHSRPSRILLVPSLLSFCYNLICPQNVLEPNVLLINSFSAISHFACFVRSKQIRPCLALPWQPMPH